MPIPRKSIPYRERILAFCQRNGIVVPPNFDAPRSSAKFVFVDLEVSPPTLLPRSTHREAEVFAILSHPDNAGRKLRILDFKRCCELDNSVPGKLVRGSAIDCLSVEENRQNEWRARLGA
jgi:hypothetical protein